MKKINILVNLPSGFFKQPELKPAFARLTKSPELSRCERPNACESSAKVAVV